MIIRDILKLKKTKSNLYNFTRRLDLFNVDTSLDYYMDDEDVKNENRFEVFEILNQMSDHRRGLWFYSIYFDNEPIAIWYEAGREGDDSNKGYIINKIQFLNAIKYLESFKEQDIKEINIDDDIQELDYIYGYDTSKLLFDNNFDLKYKENDIVIIDSVEELYSDIKEKNILCQIVKTDAKSSAFTYTLDLLEYKRIPTFDQKGNISYNNFKKYDIIDWKQVDFINEDYNSLNEAQKDCIKKYIFDDILKVSFTIPFKEENLLKRYM